MAFGMKLSIAKFKGNAGEIVPPAWRCNASALMP
jgi:hypothetical protein